MFGNGFRYAQKCTKINPSAKRGLSKLISCPMILAGKLWPSGHYSLSRAGLMGAKPLGSSLPTNSRTAPRAKQGARGMTGYGKKSLQSGVALIEESAHAKLITFATFTLPFDDPEQMSRAANSSGELLNRLIERIRRRLTRAGLPAEIAYCTELQKRGAIHFHLVYQGRGWATTWALSTMEIDQIWEDILTNAGYQFDSIKSACNVQRLKKSAVSYIAKYLSKGNCAPLPGIEGHPSSWWGLTNNLRQRVKNNIVKFTRCADYKMKWMTWMTSFHALPDMLHSNLFTLDNGLTVCIYGRTKLTGMEALRQMLATIGDDPPP
jgi:hypothetical protein